LNEFVNALRKINGQSMFLKENLSLVTEKSERIWNHQSQNLVKAAEVSKLIQNAKSDMLDSITKLE
jgi:hypothetical protein